ncbi:hypothetical protein ABZS86_06040 [Streptomyces sp. NPDC005355]|uniref:hypothetical protein n=1 Tax=Streptomyces sp. NPDC005355 TaxID=3157038 RepID=UPI0033A6F3A3
MRQIYRTTDVGSGPAPNEFQFWSDYLSSELDGAQVAVMSFSSKALRERLTSSLDLLIWGAHDSRLTYETRLSTRAVAHAAHQDAMDCLGSIRAATLSRLTLDHLLRGLRGVNRWVHHWSSNLAFWPSIQP